MRAGACARERQSRLQCARAPVHACEPFWCSACAVALSPAASARRHLTRRKSSLLQEAGVLANAWYTGNKWPRASISYTKLFLPAVHLVLALCFTVEYFAGQFSLATLQNSAMDSMEVLGDSGWFRSTTVQSAVTFAVMQVPDVLQEYTFYFALVPISLLLLVRAAVVLPPRCSAAARSSCQEPCMLHRCSSTRHGAIARSDVFAVRRPLAGRVLRPQHESQWLQGTLYSWTKEMEPAQAANFNKLLHGVVEGAAADALRFFDMDRSFIIRCLRRAASPVPPLLAQPLASFLLQHTLLLQHLDTTPSAAMRGLFSTCRPRRKPRTWEQATAAPY